MNFSAFFAELSNEKNKGKFKLEKKINDVSEIL
jgi:hypothetical protein